MQWMVLLVLHLDLLAERSILHAITNIAGTRLGFVCHLLAEMKTEAQKVLVKKGDSKTGMY